MFCFMVFFPLSPASEYTCTFELCVVMSAFVGFPDVKFTTEIYYSKSFYTEI